MMSRVWNTTTLESEVETLRVLSELRTKRWLCRGQSKRYGGLVPSIDRHGRHDLSRIEKLKLERQSIELFRSTARFFADVGEREALVNDIIALMVLRHYGVPTRLLDWSMSPYVAAYFAAESRDAEDGEIWTFDEPLYEELGSNQWKLWPQTTTDHSGSRDRFDAKLTAFTNEEPPDWFICDFYEPGFHRQTAQDGAYTMTARLGRDHADAIANLFVESSHYHRYVVRAEFKAKLRKAPPRESWHLARVAVSRLGRGCRNR